MDPHDQTEAFLRTLLRTADDPVGISRGRVIRVVNPALVALFGYEREDELIGGSFLDLMSERSGAQLARHLRARTEGRAPGAYHATGVRRDGTAFPLEIRTTAFSYEGATWSLALLRERDSDPAAELYEGIFTRNTAVKLLIDPSDGTIVDANEAAEQFYGWSREELRAMRITDINVLSADEVHDRLGAAERSEVRFFEFQHRVADGSIRDVQVHTGPVQVAGRTLLLSIFQDVSERATLQAQLQQARRLEAVGRLAGGVAHDFNNLLTVVTACAEHVATLTRDDAHVQEHLGDLLAAADRAGGVIRQLLAAGRRQPQELGTVPLDELVRTSRALLQRAAGPGIELITELQPTSVRADPAHLTQVLLNLVVNAAEALEGTGRVHLSVTSDDDAGVLVVCDEGPGMDEATRARVFEPFFTTKGADGETRGLGLASVYGIVSQSGGSLEVHSEPGEGATFTVRLPLSSEPTPEGSGPRSAPRRLLLLEDDADLRALLTEGLTQRGYEVQAEASGSPALALSDAELQRFDVLVTDHVMPGPSGADVARALARRHPALRVVVISGNLPPDERDRLPAGARFLPKPFSLRVLLAALDPDHQGTMPPPPSR